MRVLCLSDLTPLNTNLGITTFFSIQGVVEVEVGLDNDIDIIGSNSNVGQVLYWDQDEDTTAVDHFYLETSKMNIKNRYYTSLLGPHQPLYLTGPKYGPNYHEWLLMINDEFDPLWVSHPPLPLAHDVFVDRAKWMKPKIGKPKIPPKLFSRET